MVKEMNMFEMVKEEMSNEYKMTTYIWCSGMLSGDYDSYNMFYSVPFIY